MIVRLISWLLFCSPCFAAAVVIEDTPFWQDGSVKVRVSDALKGATFQKLCLDRDGVAYVLTDRGLARVLGDELVLDRSFRPLADKRPFDIALSDEGDLYHLYDDRWLSNGENGLPKGRFATGRFRHFAAMAGGRVALGSSSEFATQATDGAPTVQRPLTHARPVKAPPGWLAWVDGQQLAMAGPEGPVREWANLADATAVARRGAETVVATTNGYVVLAGGSSDAASRITALPWHELTCVTPVDGGLWFGSRRGAFFVRDPGRTNTPYATPEAPGIAPPAIRYYAGRRWLAEDEVVDLAIGADSQVWVLTRTGLQRIEFRRWTLADKAAWFERKIRSRHMRFGLTAERRYLMPGDIATSEMTDTDNDGGWSSYWLASQALRYAVTRDPEAKRSAWETFGALERLQTIHTNTGFPARSIERATNFFLHDVERWRRAPDTDWDWKGHTSSDEIASHTFAYAVLWEFATDTPAERQRIASVVDRIATHILDHDLYLHDIDGQPTLWGRWHPDYVNWFPFSAYDRRLNASEITATLQLAHRLTGRERYRDKAMELFKTAGYLTNILSSMKLLKPTSGLIHQGITMGDEWNHSDDELGFVTYWPLCRFAFTPELAAQYRLAVADHWEFEKPERYPFWNFVAAGCGLEEFDPGGAVWTLRGFPTDTAFWRMSNSHRHDVAKAEPGFLGREMADILPPGERWITRCNQQPFVLDGGDGGHTEFPGDEYVLGYWLGRWAGAIAAPRSAVP
jgi:hypothetical protein